MFKDIAGLVTTIYETLGSSVKVPHCGSKTIRVKLTVSPDQRKHVRATVINQRENKCNYNPEPNNNVDDNHCKTTCKLKKHKHHSCEVENLKEDECVNVSEDFSGTISQENENEKVLNENDGICSEHACNKLKQRRFTKSSFKRNLNESNIKIHQDSCFNGKKIQKKSTFLQRKELLDIIHTKMDNNNLGLQITRYV